MPSVKREVWRKCSSSDLIHELDGHNLTYKLDGRGEVSAYYNLHIIHLFNYHGSILNSDAYSQWRQYLICLIGKFQR